MGVGGHGSMSKEPGNQLEETSISQFQDNFIIKKHKYNNEL